MYGRTWIHVINYRFVSGNYVVLFVIEFDDVRNYGLVGDRPRTSTNGLSLSLFILLQWSLCAYLFYY
jgi:hypothetical protein